MISKWPGRATCKEQPAQNPPHTVGLSLPCRLTHLGVLLPGCHVHYRLLDPEGCNEDVDHDDDENKSRSQVVKKVQLGVLGWVVEVILDCG